jgi:hypothetical protein
MRFQSCITDVTVHFFEAFAFDSARGRMASQAILEAESVAAGRQLSSKDFGLGNP